MVFFPYNFKFSVASSIAFLISATPEVTAFICLNSDFVVFAIIFAKVVFPVPGGP